MSIFYRAVREAILSKLEQFSQDKKNLVYGNVDKLANNRNLPKWGERNALYNLPLLADAMALLEC